MYIEPVSGHKEAAEVVTRVRGCCSQSLNVADPFSAPYRTMMPKITI